MATWKGWQPVTGICATAVLVAALGMGIRPVAAQGSTEKSTYPTATEALPDGGVEYVYSDLPVQAKFPVPPPGFSPLAASDGQLAEYDFPARPNDPKALAAWQEEMSFYRRTVPTDHLISFEAPNSARALPGLSSFNWSGYVADGSFQGIQGEYNEPSLTSCGSQDAEVDWVGLGGANTNDLVQIGTGWTNSDLNLSNGINHDAWYEVLPQQPYWQVLGLSTSPGDVIFAEVGHYSGGAFMYISDNSTGNVVNFDVAVPNYDGTSAEWIGERPTVTPSGGGASNYTRLTDFQQLNWRNDSVNVEAAWQPQGSVDNTVYNMYSDNSQTLLADPYLIGTDLKSFTDYWDNCGNYEPA